MRLLLDQDVWAVTARFLIAAVHLSRVSEGKGE